jgi:hypothetical protein
VTPLEEKGNDPVPVPGVGTGPRANASKLTGCQGK